MNNIKLKEKFEQLEKIPEAEQFFILSQVGSFMNFMESAISEIDNDDITEKFQDLLDIINEKREKLAEIELKL